jgi:hypothetical protein
MRYPLIILCNLCLCITTFCQNKILADSTTKVILPYAAIIFPQAQKGLYVNNDGQFLIPSEYGAKDSIYIQMLGYNEIHTIIENIHDTVFLSPKVYILQGVVVHSGIKEIQLGNFKKHRRETYVNYKKSYFIPTIISTYIPNKQHEECFVKKLYYHYAHPVSTVRYIVRPQLYTISKEGKPDISLLHQNQLIEIFGKGTLEIDVSDEWIALPKDGVFIGLEIIEEIDPNNGTFEKSKRLPIPIFVESIKKTETYFSWFDSINWITMDWPEEKIYVKVPFSLSVKCVE